MREWLKRFQNTGVIISLVGAIGLVLQQFGVSVDLQWLDNTTTAVCYVLVILGIANNPTEPGMDIPKVSFKKDEPKW